MKSKRELEQARLAAAEEKQKEQHTKILIAYKGLNRIINKCEDQARVIAEETKIRMKAVGR